MAILSVSNLDIDHVDEGSGPVVILLHSGASSYRQWRRLLDDLRGTHRVLAPNLYGYGGTTPWSEDGAQTLVSQAQIVIELANRVEGQVSLVGHSMGGSVALKAASMIPDRIARLVLLEPNPFHLLRDHGRRDAFAEVQTLRDCTKADFGTSRWAAVAERFIEYWAGPGSWARLSPERRAAFERNLLPTYHEWDALWNEQMTVDALQVLPQKTLLMRSTEAPRSIQEICEILSAAFPHWNHEIVTEGGHMAAVTHPQTVNPVVMRFLVAGESQ